LLQGCILLNVISHYSLVLFFYGSGPGFYPEAYVNEKSPPIKHYVLVGAHGCCPHKATLPAY